MAIPLVLDEKKLGGLRSYAEAHRLPIDQMRMIVAGTAPIVGDRPEHECHLNVGWRVVFSIEEHPRKDGNGTAWLRHMSMSSSAPGRFPNSVALEEVARHLGFPGPYDCVVQRNPIDGVVEVLAEAK